MPSFDVVSELNMQEVDNAVNQARKEILTRYDFKTAKADVTLDQEGIHLTAIDEYKMKALIDVLQSKAIKRGVSLKSFDTGKIDPAAGCVVKCLGQLVHGI